MGDEPAAVAGRVAGSGGPGGLVTALYDWLVLEPVGAANDRVADVLRLLNPASGARPAPPTRGWGTRAGGWPKSHGRSTRRPCRPRRSSH